MVQSQPTFTTNFTTPASIIQQPSIIQAVPQPTIQQPLEAQIQTQIIHNQQQNVPLGANLQSQWFIPSYTTLGGQNIIQLQPIQQVHVIQGLQSQSTLQPLMPIQIQQQLQAQFQPSIIDAGLESSMMQDHHNMQIKLAEYRQQVGSKVESEVNSECNISRYTLLKYIFFKLSKTIFQK